MKKKTFVTDTKSVLNKSSHRETVKILSVNKGKPRGEIKKLLCQFGREKER